MTTTLYLQALSENVGESVCKLESDAPLLYPRCCDIRMKIKRKWGETGRGVEGEEGGKEEEEGKERGKKTGERRKEKLKTSKALPAELILYNLSPLRKASCHSLALRCPERF